MESAGLAHIAVMSVVEPRDFWDRNSVLAEAFCASDERVRHAQSVLHEAQAERSRALAAFAVTVGRDGTIADLMGLNEREVRTARRTVGRGTARTVAERLLSYAPKPTPIHEAPAPPTSPPTAPPQAPGQFTAQGPVQTPAPGPVVAGPHAPASTHQEEPSATLPSQVPPLPTTPPSTPQNAPQAAVLDAPQSAVQHATPASPMTPQDPTASTTGHGSDGPNNAVIWSSSMDSVLVWSWKSGLDLQTVAAELGLDVRTLLLRVQVLADDGLLTPANQPTPGSDLAPSQPVRRRSGRHRRHHEDAYTAFFGPTTTTFPTYVPR